MKLSRLIIILVLAVAVFPDVSTAQSPTWEQRKANYARKHGGCHIWESCHNALVHWQPPADNVFGAAASLLNHQGFLPDSMYSPSRVDYTVAVNQYYPPVVAPNPVQPIYAQPQHIEPQVQPVSVQPATAPAPVVEECRINNGVQECRTLDQPVQQPVGQLVQQYQSKQPISDIRINQQPRVEYIVITATPQSEIMQTEQPQTLEDGFNFLGWGTTVLVIGGLLWLINKLMIDSANRNRQVDSAIGVHT